MYGLAPKRSAIFFSAPIRSCEPGSWRPKATTLEQNSNSHNALIHACEQGSTVALFEPWWFEPWRCKLWSLACGRAQRNNIFFSASPGFRILEAPQPPPRA